MKPLPKGHRTRNGDTRIAPAKKNSIAVPTRENQGHELSFSDHLAINELKEAIEPPEVRRALASMRLSSLRVEMIRRKGIGGLSEVQERRAIARLQGKSMREIARDEGRAISTIAESLRAPSVRARIAAELRLIRVTNQADGKETPLLQAVVEELARIALGATRPHRFEMVPDNNARISAIETLLRYYDPGVGSEGRTAGVAPFVEQDSLERTVTATERRVRTRTRPAQSYVTEFEEP